MAEEEVPFYPPGGNMALTPQQQAWLLNYLFGGATGMGPYAPSIDPAMFATSFGQVPMDVDKYGEQMPWGLDQENTATTLMGKRNSMMGDMMTGFQGGPGAWDPRAFDPIVVSEEEVVRPGRQQIDYWLDKGPGTIEYMIAEELANGGSKTSAYGSVVQFLQSNPNDFRDDPQLGMTADQLRDLQQRMLAGVPQVYNETKGDYEPDFTAVQKIADKMEADLLSDPKGNYITTDPETGREVHYNRQTEDSPATQAARVLGLSTPFEEYTMDHLMGPGYAEGNAMLGEAQRSYDQRRKSQPSANDTIRQYREMLAKGPRTSEVQAGQQSYEYTPMEGIGGARQGKVPTEFALTMNPMFAPDRAQAIDPQYLQGSGAGGYRQIGAEPGTYTVAEDGGTQRARSRMRRALDSGSLERRRKDEGRERARMSMLYRSIVGDDAGTQLAMLEQMRNQGRTPLTDQLLQRRMAMMAAGLQGGGYLPGS